MASSRTKRISGPGISVLEIAPVRKSMSLGRTGDGSIGARSPGDKGSVIDFYLQYGSARNVRDAIKGLREWCMIAPPNADYRRQSDANEETAEWVQKNREVIQDQFVSMKTITRHRYLEEERGIPALALQHWRWAGRIMMDRRSNAAFVHRDNEGVCGWEIRNFKFKGFSPGGSKGLFESKSNPRDHALYFCESGIDAVSLSVINDEPLARYASVAGQISNAQPRLIKAAIERMPDGSQILAAMDADVSGRRLARSVEIAFEAAKRPMTFRQIEPVGFKDWNAQLAEDCRPETVRMRTLIPA